METPMGRSVKLTVDVGQLYLMILADIVDLLESWTT